jgi:L-fuconolactonase
MMRIDAHQHFWRYTAAEYGWIDESMSALWRDFLPADSERELGSVGFNAGVAVQARQTLDETSWLLSLADTSPSIAGVVGWVDLQAGASRVGEQIESFGGSPKLVGVRHIVDAEPDERFLVRPQVLDGLSVLREFGLTFDLLIDPRHLAVAAECVGCFPEQRFVLDHLAKPRIRGGELDAWERDIHALARHSNVFAKLSGLVTEADWHNWTDTQLRPYLDVAFEAFGYQRLMIGSDWPVCLVAAPYARTMGVVLEYLSSRPAHEREAVVGGNAQRFWRLKGDHTDVSRVASAAARPDGVQPRH